MKKTTEVKCCNQHEENVQLIWTFAFPGAEYWCPYCGHTHGMLGAGEIRELDMKEKRDMIKYRNIGKEFLKARSTLVCESLIWEGERITPDKLPNEEIKRCRDIISNWSYPIDKILNQKNG